MAVDQTISFWGALYFVITGSIPFGRVTNLADSDHIQIDIYDTLMEMGIRFNSSGVIAVFPERSLPVLSLIELLGGSTGDQLHALRDNIPAAIKNQKVDMVGSYNIIEDLEAIAFPGLKPPIKIPLPIFRIVKETPVYGICG
jgi:hypothetical protein